MTPQDLIDTVKDNLGNRSSGRIGNRSVDVVVLEALNLALPHAVLEAQPDYYKRTCTINIVTGTQAYDLPVLDDDGIDIRIKNIYAVRCSRAGGTGVHLEQTSFVSFVKDTPDYDQENEGLPSKFALWGKTNKLYLNYVPTEDLTLTLFVETHPITITSVNLTDPLPIGDEWNIVLEAFTTQHCYLKLQQLDMYTIWNDLYLKQKAAISRDSNEKDSHGIGVGTPGGCSNDPLLDPFVSRWN